ncbi:MAG: tetratricopeptide repeat protein [Alphaproteobacteria bacterium]|nr:tetratricopeptide repeat protein [Alphaproteobacteria bacterium]MDA8012579.1 tetratricopeptide repeat protein [Alphaproteobacteria bacterium]
MPENNHKDDLQARAHELLERAEEAIERSDFDRATALCTEAIGLNSDNYQAYHMRGVCRVERGKHDAGVNLRSKVLKLDPTIMKGEYELAIEDFNKAIEIGRYYPRAYHSRGLAYMLKGDFKRAIADYDRVIAMNPRNVDAYRDRGLAYVLKGDIPRGIEDYNKAMEMTITPNKPRLNSWTHHLETAEEEAAEFQGK